MNVRFFCGGPIKSGTTFLQRLLDSHPSISCYSEQYFNFLLKDLMAVHKRYNDVLFDVANLIGVQPNLMKQEAFLEGFYKIVGSFFDLQSEKKIIGINDNDFIIHNAKPILKNIKNSKIIYILRNPIDTSLSTWDHYQSLYIRKNNKKFLEKLVVDGELNKEKFIIKRSRELGILASKILNNAKTFSTKVLVIQYEELTNNKENTIKKITNFLGADSSAKVLEELITNTSFEFMKKNSTNPSFYKKGRINAGHSEISQKVFHQAMLEASDLGEIYSNNII